MTNTGKNNGGERFTGHGSEWRDSRLSSEDAMVATSWVEQKIDKRSMLTNKDRVEDVRDVMWQLEKEGEIVVHRVADEHEPVDVKTLYGCENVAHKNVWNNRENDATSSSKESASGV